MRKRFFKIVINLHIHGAHRWVKMGVSAGLAALTFLMVRCEAPRHIDDLLDATDSVVVERVINIR